jgi:uncharacterized protein (DUF1800 family)
MNKMAFIFTGIAILATAIGGQHFFQPPPDNDSLHQDKIHFPYENAGLSRRQAAAHLLSRFTYGATPGQVDEVLKTGLESWFEEQLDHQLPDDTLNQMLSGYDALLMSNTEIVQAFPRPLQVMRMAAEEGVIPKDSIQLIDKKAYRQRLNDFIQSKKLRQQSDLVRQFINQRILRSAYSNNQLQEVLTGFWFNHFNVSLTKREAVLLLPAYERDVIRPNTLGKFEDLLLATAKSPAMLIYLDNFISSGESGVYGMNAKRDKQQAGLSVMLTDSGSLPVKPLKKPRAKNTGLNENYAREVMELHTLGVDGGYSQADVTEAARILTGWTIYPIADGYSPLIKRLIDKEGEQALTDRGFVREKDFMFAMNRHDSKEKKVLGRNFPANGGYREGVELLKMLAHHPSTARFISGKLAAYFVSDDPPKSLVDKMAKTFLDKEGSIREVLITMVNAPEFWDKAAIRSKTKSPFEFVISAIRALDASIENPSQLFSRMDKMGQRIYYFQAPTGFPDRAQYWINTGSLLNRMNFGLDIASQKVRGVKADLLKLNNYHEPESPAAALETYASLLIPGRDMEPTIKRLTPLLTDPLLNRKVENATGNSSGAIKRAMPENYSLEEEEKLKETEEKIAVLPVGKNNIETQAAAMLAQVVGIIIGSPEFQRR